MPKLKDESNFEYKKRVLDPVSDSFCAAKWLNATIWLGSGSTASCHHPRVHAIDLEEIKNNPSALHNTKHKKKTRAQMLRGDKPNECDYCWKIEKINEKHVSDRVFKSSIYSDDDLRKISRMDPGDDVDLKTLEIAFDRYCNFACSYCNSSFSTKWSQDIAKNGPYQNLVSDGAGAYHHDGSWATPYESKESNPYIDAFWKWWPKLRHSLQQFRITGGEPLLSPDLWKILDYFEHNGSGEMTFSINSNLGVNDALFRKLMDKSKYIKNFEIYTSCEAFGKQAEYIRDGLDFQIWTSRVEQLISHTNLKTLHVMMTVNSLSLFSITELMDKMLSWKEQYGAQFPVWTVNILRFPSFMSPLALPQEIRQERQAVLKQWYEEKKNHPLLRTIEKDGLTRLIDYLGHVDQPHQKTSNRLKLAQDFKSFFRQYDIRRKKSLLNCFPELSDWINSISITQGPDQKLIRGDARDWHCE